MVEDQIGEKFGLTFELSQGITGEIFKLLETKGLSMEQGIFIVTCMTCSGLEVLADHKDQRCLNLILMMLQSSLNTIHAQMPKAKASTAEEIH